MCKLMACVGVPFSLRTIEHFYNKFSGGNPHAAGYALYHDNSVLLGKQPGPGTALFDRDKDLIENTLPQTSLGLFHVRFATHGHPSNNKNNHPIYHSVSNKVKSMIIHNGMVSVDKNLPSDGQTDTEQLLCYWDEEGPECLNKFSGSAAIVVVSNGKLYVYRHRAPLFFKQTDSGIYFHQDYEYKGKTVPKDTVFEVSLSTGLTPVLKTSMKSTINWGSYITCQAKSPLMKAKEFWNSYEDNNDESNLDDESLEWKEICKKYGLSEKEQMYSEEE